MPAYKYQTKAGKQFWYASFCYTAWNGESKRMVKRGFKTKKEALVNIPVRRSRPSGGG